MFRLRLARGPRLTLQFELPGGRVAFGNLGDHLAGGIKTEWTVASKRAGDWPLVTGTDLRTSALDHGELVAHVVVLHVVHEGADQEQPAAAGLREFIVGNGAIDPAGIESRSLVPDDETRRVAIDPGMNLDVSLSIRSQTTSFFGQGLETLLVLAV